VEPTPNGLTITLPNGELIRSTHTALLPFHDLPIEARRAHLFPALQNKALILIGQICDSGFVATLNAKSIHITHPAHDTISGTRDHRTGMWTLDVPPQTTNSTAPTIHPMANNVYSITTQAEMINYLHRACFSPVISTWIKAIKDAGYFATWLGLTSKLVTKHLAKSIDTAKGHLRQNRQNVRSTKTAPNLKSCHWHPS
jgi:hypothetical protein